VKDRYFLFYSILVHLTRGHYARSWEYRILVTCQIPNSEEPPLVVCRFLTRWLIDICGSSAILLVAHISTDHHWALAAAIQVLPDWKRPLGSMQLRHTWAHWTLDSRLPGGRPLSGMLTHCGHSNDSRGPGYERQIPMLFTWVSAADADDRTLAEGILDCLSNASIDVGFNNASVEPESIEPSVPFVSTVADVGKLVWPIGDVGEFTDIGDNTFHGLGATWQSDKPYSIIRITSGNLKIAITDIRWIHSLLHRLWTLQKSLAFQEFTVWWALQMPCSPVKPATVQFLPRNTYA